MKIDKLLEPFESRTLSLPNRIVMAPMTRSLCPQHAPDDAVAAYYRRRAENSVGLVITEGTPVHPAGHAYPNLPAFYGETALAAWKNVVDQVHAAGGKIFPQLWHAGSVRQPGMPPQPDVPGLGPSAVLHPSMKEGQPPAEMTFGDIAEAVKAFAAAASNAEHIGFDGIEIHGAHSYLIDQFFWERTNRRTDSFGGSHAWERTRFAEEIIRTVRTEVDVNFPICFRFSQWKIGAFEDRLASTPQELEKLLTPLVDAGVDLFHCSTRRFFDPEFNDSDLNLAGWTRKITGKPVITVGSVGLDRDFISFMAGGQDSAISQKSIDNLLERLTRQEFDLVAVGRALLADPAWVTKVARNRFDDIIPFTKEALESLS